MWLDAAISAVVAIIGGVAKMAVAVTSGENFSFLFFLCNVFISFTAGFMWGFLAHAGAVGHALTYGLAVAAGFAGGKLLEAAESALKRRVENG